MALAADILGESARMRFPLDGDPVRAVFRPYRDVRFSADKRPYKTHLGIALTRSGRKSDPGVLYVHVLPGGCFVAAGFHRPERDALARLRHAIIAEQSAFRRVVAGLDAAGIPLEADPDAAKRLPRDCEAAGGTPVEPFVKAKRLIVRRHVPDALAGDAGLVDAVMAFAEDAKPLLAFGWRALDRR